MTREEVIKSLETAVKNFERYSGDEYGREYDYARVGVDVLEDALALLKARLPRVMTLEELLATEVVYAEDIDKNEIIPVLVDRRAHDRIVLVRAHLMGGPSLTIYPLISEYGTRWRCWTSRPDEKRRAETPWDAQGQRDYEAAVEMAEYCEHYEPTYNADDGSM